MVGLFVFAFAQLSRFPDTVINFRTQMPTSYAELGETCVATTAQLGLVIFFCCAYATAAFRPVVPISILRDARTSLDATLAKCRCVVARAEKRTLYHSAGVVDTRHFAKIRVSQSDLRSKINHHGFPDAKRGAHFRVYFEYPKTKAERRRHAMNSTTAPVWCKVPEFKITKDSRLDIPAYGALPRPGRLREQLRRVQEPVGMVGLHDEAAQALQGDGAPRAQSRTDSGPDPGVIRFQIEQSPPSER